MIAVYPVTLHNSSLYEPLATLLAKMGPNREHDLYIVTCPAALETAQIFGKACERLFRKVDIGIVANIVEKTPAGRNAMFRDAVYLLEKAGNTSPWIWMENAYPIDRDWLQMVQEEWNAKPVDRAFLGCVVNAYLPAMKDGKRRVGEDGGELYQLPKPYMRFGVYPHDLAKRSIILHSLASIPFEIDMRDEIVPKCHHSKIIKTMWASKNYARTRHGYSGEQSPEYEQAIRKNEPVSIGTEGAAILHGCRDGSMLMVLTGQHWNSPSNLGRTTPKSTGDKDRVFELEAKIAELQAQLQGKYTTEGCPQGPRGTEGVPGEYVLTDDDAPAVLMPLASQEGTAILSDENGPRAQGQPFAVVEEEEPVAAPSLNAAPKKRGRPRKLVNA